MQFLGFDFLRLFRRGEAVKTEAASPAKAQPSNDAPPLVSVYGPENYVPTQPLAVAAVCRCVQLLSESVASLPLQYLRKRGSIFVDDTTDALHYLLNVQPDKGVTAFDFWRGVVVEVLLDGNAYIIPVFGVRGQIERLVLCTRGCVMHDTLNGTYKVSDVNAGIHGTYTEDEIIHIKGELSRSSKRGISVLSYAAQTVRTASVGDKETLNRFANGGNVKGIVSNDTSARGFGEYQDEQLKKTAEDIDARFRSGQRIVNLPGQADFKPISLSSTDMQFLESRKFTVREFCRFFGVHPSYVFDDTSNNYKSAELSVTTFLTTTLNPLLRKIECALQTALVSRGLYGKVKLQFDRRALFSLDLGARIDYQTKTIAAGIYTINDWRAEENKPSVEGGDRVLVSANLRGIDELTTQQNNNTKSL